MIPFFFCSGKFDWFLQKVIALSYLLESSKILAPLQLQDSQTLIVKALRSCASDVVDVRLLVSEPSSSIWFGRRDNIKDAGGYEIRRKDWVDGASRRFEGFSKAYWEKHTIYVVRSHLSTTIRTYRIFHRSTYPYSTEQYQESHDSSFLCYPQMLMASTKHAYKTLLSCHIIKTNLAIIRLAKGSHW